MLKRLSTGKSEDKWDAAGVGLSALCVAHCLLFPATAVAAPMLAPGLSETLGLGHEWHIGLLLVAIPISLLALGWGARRNGGGWALLGVGIVGLGLMTLGALHLFSFWIETALTLTGVTILAVAHLANWRIRWTRGHDHRRDCAVCETAPD